MKTLIVVDMQNDFVTGSLGTKEAQAIVPKIKEKIKEYRQSGNRVIFTRDTHYENYLETKEGKMLPVKHCIYNTDGWQIVDGLEFDGCEYVNKESFGWNNWNDRNYYDDIELVGVCTDICVISNALILKAQFSEDIDIIVDASCCAGCTPELHRAALDVMRSCQINVIGDEKND